MEDVILHFTLGDFYVNIQRKKEDMGYMQHMIKNYFKTISHTVVTTVPHTHAEKFELATGDAHDSYNVICYGTNSEFEKDTEFVGFWDIMWDILLK